MEITVAIVMASIAAFMALVAIGGMVYNAGRWSGKVEALELAQQAEVKRNDEITQSMIDAAAELSKETKLLLQRVTKVETICECLARRKGCEDDRG